MRTLNIENIKYIHQELINKTGGIYGVKNESLLDSALNRTFITFDNTPLYHSIEEKIAVTTHSLICNHCFNDGNKRIGIATMIILLELNEIELTLKNSELIDLGFNIAKGEFTEKEIFNWIMIRKK